MDAVIWIILKIKLKALRGNLWCQTFRLPLSNSDEKSKATMPPGQNGGITNNSLKPRSTLAWLGCRQGSGWNPRLLIALAYMSAGVSFIIMMNLNKIVDIRDLPYYPMTKIVFGSGKIYSSWHATILLICWSEHYLRRVVEVLFIHQYRHPRSSIEVFGAIIYYTFFGAWIGWSVNMDWYMWLKKGPPLYLVVLGFALFAGGEVMNAMCHWMLMKVRRRPPSTRRQPAVHREELTETVSFKVLPSRQSSAVNQAADTLDSNCGFFENFPDLETIEEADTVTTEFPNSVLFHYVKHPHYVFEFIAWVGYAMLAFTWATWIFALVSGLSMLVLGIVGRRRRRT